MTDFENKIKYKKGFTLVELLIVSTIIGLLATAAISLLYDQSDRARNAARDSDVRSIISSSRFVKVNEGTYPVNSEDFIVRGGLYISDIPFDPLSERLQSSIGQPLQSFDTYEYTYASYKPQQDYTEERVLASARFEVTSNIDEKNIYAGRYAIGTMGFPASSELWTQGSATNLLSINGGTVILK